MVLRILIAVACVTGVAHASPVDDLASPSQATRDAAAARLRATYKPPPGDAWIRKLGAIRPGTTKQSVVSQLTREQAHPLGVFGDSHGRAESYRLDDGWVLLCMYRLPAEAVITCKVSSGPRHVLVEPPHGYTGPWVDYLVNGQRASESTFKDGVHVGTTTVFHANGKRAMVRTHGPDGKATSIVWYDETGAVKRRVGAP
jgi:hypothetical protein